MARLSRDARQQIRESGRTVVGFTREWFGGDVWHGDSCGCPDDRCIGHHHYEQDDCGCLPAVLAS